MKRKIIIPVIFLFFIFVSDIFSQNETNNAFRLKKREPASDQVIQSDYTKHFRFYISPGITFYKEYNETSVKFVLTADLVPQLNKWLYLDFKGDLYNYENLTYAGGLSVIPSAGFEIINKKFMLMAGTGFTLWGTKAGHQGIAVTSTTFVRPQYEIMYLLGVYTEFRYGFTPYGGNGDSDWNNHFFINAGIFLQKEISED